MFELIYHPDSGVILQLFNCIRLSMVYKLTDGNGKYFSVLSFGIWKFDISLALEMDKDAENIKDKYGIQ